MISSTISVACPPICSPTLPPLISKKAGADQPEGVRQLATPRPPCPASMNPAFTTRGNPTTHSAFSSKSRGIPLSGVPIISVSTLAALAAWLAPSLVFGPRKGGSVGVGAGFGFGFLWAAAVTAVTSKQQKTIIVRTVFLFIFSTAVYVI